MVHRLVAVAAALSLGGCALALSGPDPKRRRTEVPRCDTGKGAVAIDGVWVGMLGLATLLALDDEEAEIGLVSGAFAAAFLASAIRGSNVVNECRGAWTDYQAAIASDVMRVGSRRTRDRFDTRRRRPVPAIAPDETDEPVDTTPPPTATPPVKPAPPAPTPAPPRPPADPVDSDDEWSSFWREVP